MIVAVVLALLAPWPAVARTLTVRSGEHEDFSRLAIAEASSDWQWAGDGGAYTLTTGADNTLDISSVFRLIPRTRILSLRAEAGVLFVQTAPDTAVEAQLQGKLFVIDVRSDKGSPDTAPATPGSVVAADPPQTAGDSAKQLGQIASLPGVGTRDELPSPQAQSIEQALLFRIAKAAGEGSLSVADKATLDALRRAGLTPTEPGNDPASIAAKPTTDAPAPDPGAATVLAQVTCDEALAALTFPQPAPTTIRDYEQAYLAMDKGRNDPGLVDLARGYLALALPAEALAILRLRADPLHPTARVIEAAAARLDDRSPPETAADLARLRDCGAAIDIWAMAQPGAEPPRADPYALFQALLAVPGPARAALIDHIRRNLGPTPADASAASLLRLLADIAPDCGGTGDCADPAAGSGDLSGAVTALSQLASRTLTQRAQTVLADLSSGDGPIAPDVARHLDAMAFERRREPGGPLMKAGALVAYARAGDYDQAFANLARLPAVAGKDPVMAAAATRVLDIWAAKAGDADFLRLSFAQAALISSWADERTQSRIQERLAHHGFGTSPGVGRTAAGHVPTTAASTPSGQVDASAPPGSAMTVATVDSDPAGQDARGALSGQAPSAQAAEASPPIISSAGAPPHLATDTAQESDQTAATPRAGRASVGVAPNPTPQTKAAEAAAAATLDPTAASPLIAASHDLTSASATLRQSIADSLAKAGATSP